MKINGLNLPACLIDALLSKVWIKNGIGWKSIWSGDDLEAFKSLFPLCNYFRPALYSYDLMESETKAFVIDVDENDLIYYGHKSSEYMPGNIDPQRTVIIGETAEDSPIALDYRAGPEPSVIYLCCIGNDSYWVKAVDNIEQFLIKLGFMK